MRFSSCPACGSNEITYAFPIMGRRLEGCSDCDLLFVNPQPDNKEISLIREQQGGLARPDSSFSAGIGRADGVLTTILLDVLFDYCPSGEPKGKKLISIGLAKGSLPGELEARGFDVTDIQVSEALHEDSAADLGGGVVYTEREADIPLSRQSFDVCVLADIIDRVRNPLDLLSMACNLLKPGGVVVIGASLLDIPPSRRRNKFARFESERLFYFNPTNLQTLIYRTGFSAIKMYPCDGRGQVFNPGPSWVVAAATKSNCVPKKLSKLSIILPVYNERPTFPSVVGQVMEKIVPGLETEIVIVESNSTDGTREEVLKLRDQPNVKIVLQDRARGKGNAVREGLQHASGDIILIQDGDLEYDLWDYEALIRPILQLHRSFTLGARHGGSPIKMRRFIDKPFLAWTINLGHKLLTLGFNLLYGQRLRDPWTMFKVFRRDCIRGIIFECDRFDFDIELVIKLIRQGFIPSEIPVNYVSRSFSEGKKVSFTKDPLRILKAMLKYRFLKQIG